MESATASKKPTGLTSGGVGDVKIPQGAIDVGKFDDKKAKEISKQIEYYFGDVNLPRDKFLRSQVETNKDGWVPLSIMLKFNRLLKITENVAEISTAVRKHSALMEVSTTGDEIRRRPDCPLPENSLEYWLEVKRRTVYVKGFPQEATIDELIPFFNKFGDVVNVLMRKTVAGNPRIFKGSVFVTFKDVEGAEKFANDETPLTYRNGAPMIKMMQEEYWAKKNKEGKERKGANKTVKNAKNAQVAKEQKEGIDAAHFVKGIVLKVNGLPECKFVEVKEFFMKFGSVAFVKIDSNNNEALVRFDSKEENAAQAIWDKALEANGGKVEFPKGDVKHELTASVLTGSEESAYWVEFNNSKLHHNDKFRAKNQQKYGGGKKKSQHRDGKQHFDKHQRDEKPQIDKSTNGATKTEKAEMEVDDSASRKRTKSEDASPAEEAGVEKKPRRIIFTDDDSNATNAEKKPDVEAKKEKTGE